MARFGIWHMTLLAGIAVGLAGCEEAPFNLSRDAGSTEAASSSGTVRLVERDVEAPEVFQENDRGLWDGRPSLGGVWVAYPGVSEPERVIIRNSENNQFVIGALFRREREHPGPLFQVSSDAAAALGMLAGQPTDLNVTALRRQEVTEPETAVEQRTLAETAAPAPEEPRDDVAALAEAAISAVESPAAAPATASPSGAPARPYVQIGIFSVEANANGAAQTMRDAGMTANVTRETSQGATFWRVTVGPAANIAERDRLLANARRAGFADAYAVSR